MVCVDYGTKISCLLKKDADHREIAEYADDEEYQVHNGDKMLEKGMNWIILEPIWISHCYDIVWSIISKFCPCQ